jgi:hypothetical protein
MQKIMCHPFASTLSRDTETQRTERREEILSLNFSVAFPLCLCVSSVVSHTDAILSSVVRARRTLARIVSADFIQVNDLGLALWPAM